MGSLFEEGVNWFVKMMERSVSSNECVELSRNTLQIDCVNQLLVKSSSVDIKILFSTDESSYSIVSHPDMSKDAIRVTVTAEGSSGEIIIDKTEEKAKSYNVTVIFRLSSAIEKLVIESETGDITINGCRARETSLISDSGDITVCDHISPCQTEAIAENGDVSGACAFSKTSKNKLICKTANGDIVFV